MKANNRDYHDSFCKAELSKGLKPLESWKSVRSDKI